MKRVLWYWTDGNVLTSGDGNDGKFGQFKLKTGEFYAM